MVGCVIEKSKEYHGLVVRGEAAQVIQMEAKCLIGVEECNR